MTKTPQFVSTIKHPSWATKLTILDNTRQVCVRKMDIDADLHTAHRPDAHMVVTLVSAWAQIKTNVLLDQFIFIQKN